MCTQKANKSLPHDKYIINIFNWKNIKKGELYEIQNYKKTKCK